MKRRYTITVTQIIENDKLDHEDQNDNPAGQWDYWASNEELALDQFHDNVAISCLEHFKIRIEKNEN